jgi:periplasmic protein TonB
MPSIQGTAPGRSLRTGIVVLLLGGFLFGQKTSDKPSDSDAGQGQETVYKAGTKGVAAPSVVYQVDPEYSAEALRAGVNAMVALRIVVNSAGKPTGIRVIKDAGYGLEEKAVEAIRQWKFKPGTKDGKPVAVEIAIQIEFHAPVRY